VRLLLDTHALLFWLDGDRRLGARAKRAIAATESEVLVSAASAWEVATKFRIGKLPSARDAGHDLAGCVRAQGFTALAIDAPHAQLAGLLTWDHRDPFDRMLAAQTLLESVTLVSNDEAFDSIGVPRLW